MGIKQTKKNVGKQNGDVQNGEQLDYSETSSNFEEKQISYLPLFLSYSDLNIGDKDLNELQDMFQNIHINREDKVIICTNYEEEKAVEQLLSKVKLYNFPFIWEKKFKLAQDKHIKYQIFNLDKNSNEFNRLVSEFKLFNSEDSILSIQRIQNPHLWQAYELEAKSLRQKLGKYSPELSLWHGTSKAPPEKIIESGFNKTFAKNGMFGYGNYFALESKYSTNHYSHNIEEGVKSVLLALVLLGDPSKSVDRCRSQPTLKSNFSDAAPFTLKKPTLPKQMLPKRDESEQVIENDTQLRYDSVNSHDRIFVVYENQKAYPQYYFKFKKEK